MLFSHRVQPKLSLRQVTFNDIADFVVRVRAPCWQDRGFGPRSPHNQWHPFIKDLWKIADPQGPDSQVKVQAILEHSRRSPNNTLEPTARTCETLSSRCGSARIV